MNLPVGHEQPRECGVFRVSRRGRDGLRTFGACPPLRFGLLRIELASLGSNQTPFRSGFCVPGNFVLIGTSLPAASVRFESGAPSRPDTKNPAFAGLFVTDRQIHLSFARLARMFSRLFTLHRHTQTQNGSVGIAEIGRDLIYFQDLAVVPAGLSQHVDFAFGNF